MVFIVLFLKQHRKWRGGVFPAFYIIFTACERAAKEIEAKGGKSEFENVIDVGHLDTFLFLFFCIKLAQIAS